MVKNLMSFPALRRRRSSDASSDPALQDKRFRAIFDAAPVGIALADEQGRAIESNQALRDLLGYTVEELRARTYVDYTHPDDLPDNLRASTDIVLLGPPNLAGMSMADVERAAIEAEIGRAHV